MGLAFMCGFPRSGSTVLMNILGQNPEIHPTSTSGLINTAVNIRDNWNKNPVNMAQDPKEIEVRVMRMIDGAMKGYYSEEIEKGKMVIDKNRGWAKYIDLLSLVLDGEVRIIYPIRSVTEILNSFEKLHRESPMFRKGGGGFNEYTTNGRSETLMSNEGVVGFPLNAFREIMFRGFTDHICFIPFDLLMKETDICLRYVEHYLGIKKPFDYDLENIQQLTYENDLIHGYSSDQLHKVRKKIEKPKTENLLPTSYKVEIEKRTKDVSNFMKAMELEIIKKFS